MGAYKLPACKCLVPGITLSPRQVQRGTELAAERGLNNVSFKVGAETKAQAGRQQGQPVGTGGDRWGQVDCVGAGGEQGQVQRGTQLAAERGLNVTFKVGESERQAG